MGAGVRTEYGAEDRPVLEKDAAAKVLELVRDTRYHLPFWIAMAGGLRRGEVLGLTWEDVELEAGILHVRHQWGKLNVGGPYGLAPVKTKASVRDVPIPQDLADALAAHQVTQKASSAVRGARRRSSSTGATARPSRPSRWTPPGSGCATS